MKIKLIYSYNGSNFSGSQSQPHKNSVEDRLKMALFRVGIFEKLTTASRTDKGVHALNQVSTTNCGEFWDLNKLKEQLNRHARPFIYIKKIEKVSSEFHPRFSAKKRSYRYILNHSNFSPFLENLCLFYDKIDIEKLNLSLSKFIGKHDFKNFMKTGSDIKDSIREIYKAYAFSYNNLTIIKFEANGFLRSQVRLMVANVLKEQISNQKFTLEKSITRIPAPPNALYLERIFY